MSNWLACPFQYCVSPYSPISRLYIIELVLEMIWLKKQKPSWLLFRLRFICEEPEEIMKVTDQKGSHVSGETGSIQWKVINLSSKCAFYSVYKLQFLYFNINRSQCPFKGRSHVRLIYFSSYSQSTVIKNT